MSKFSERYDYATLSLVLIRESMTDEIINAICTTYDLLAQKMVKNTYPYRSDFYEELEKHLWCYFCNNRLGDFYHDRGFHIVATKYIKSDNPWYKKIDLIEETLSYLFNEIKKGDSSYYDWYQFFVNYLNNEFKRLNFAYRIVGNRIEEITSEQEIQSIEEALLNPLEGIRIHLQAALKHVSAAQEKPDYRASIKESISAVGVCCRIITGEKTLGKALNKLEKNGIIIPSLKTAFDKLYVYTNDETTGIRHELLDPKYTPTADEAIFMLISCSAFINYLTKKKT